LSNRFGVIDNKSVALCVGPFASKSYFHELAVRKNLDAMPCGLDKIFIGCSDV